MARKGEGWAEQENEAGLVRAVVLTGDRGDGGTPIKFAEGKWSRVL
jgi:hypothetical protein